MGRRQGERWDSLSVEEPVLYVIAAAATVLCVGSCGYKPAAYPPIVQLTGDGEAMAYRGAEILGKEFVDTHISRVDIPVGIPNMLGRNSAVSKAALEGLDGPKRGKKLYNAEGNPLTRPEGSSKYSFTYPETEFEAHAGRAPIYTDAPDGEKEMVGGACLGMSLRKADGLWPADLHGRSTLPGLFAAGDALGTMQNGAAYAFTMVLAIANGAVSGALIGEAAAEEALRTGRCTFPMRKFRAANPIYSRAAEAQRRLQSAVGHPTTAEHNDALLRLSHQTGRPPGGQPCPWFCTIRSSWRSNFLPGTYTNCGWRTKPEVCC